MEFQAQCSIITLSALLSQSMLCDLHFRLAPPCLVCLASRVVSAPRRPSPSANKNGESAKEGQQEEKDG
jgi:hypothetical protein